MKKYLLSSLAVIGLVSMTSVASAGTPNHWYGLVEGGYGIGINNNGDTGNFGVGMGFKLNEYMRTDVIASGRFFGDVDYKAEGKPDAWSIPVMWNVYGSVPVYQQFSIYGTGGIGAAYNKIDSTTNAKGDHKMAFAWNVGGGIEYMIDDCWSVDLGYRYMDLGKGRVKARDGFVGKTGQDLRAHDIKLTLAYYF